MRRNVLCCVENKYIQAMYFIKWSLHLIAIIPAPSSPVPFRPHSFSTGASLSKIRDPIIFFRSAILLFQSKGSHPFRGHRIKLRQKLKVESFRETPWGRTCGYGTVTIWDRWRNFERAVGRPRPEPGLLTPGPRPPPRTSLVCSLPAPILLRWRYFYDGARDGVSQQHWPWSNQWGNHNCCRRTVLHFSRRICVFIWWPLNSAAIEHFDLHEGSSFNFSWWNRETGREPVTVLPVENPSQWFNTNYNIFTSYVATRASWSKFASEAIERMAAGFCPFSISVADASHGYDTFAVIWYEG